jgi:hypothetical protein
VVDPHFKWVIDILVNAPQGSDLRRVDLCRDCGDHAAMLLGFWHDKGMVLSSHQGERVTEQKDRFVERPGALPAGAMK